MCVCVCKRRRPLEEERGCDGIAVEGRAVRDARVILFLLSLCKEGISGYKRDLACLYDKLRGAGIYTFFRD